MIDLKDPSLFLKVLNYYGIDVGNLDDLCSYKTLCPFHEDIDPSMMINIEQCSWFCFGCQKGGGILEFICEYERKLNKLECYQILIRIHRSKSKFDKHSFIYSKESPKKKDRKKLLIQAHDYFFSLKNTNWNSRDKDILDVKKYMNNRGFSNEILNKFDARYNYSNEYPIVFPIYDIKLFKGWVSRTTNPNNKSRKYLYNRGFSRNQTILGNYRSRVIMVVEGYLDWLKTKQFGTKYSSCIFGWKITKNQIKKYKSSGVEVIIDALDNDDRGKDGSIELSKHFKVIKFPFNRIKPNVKDIGDLDFKIYRKAINYVKERNDVNEFN